MVRRSPAEFYLKYLLVHPDGYTDGQIRELVKSQQLDFIGMPYLNRLRSVCVPPSPFFPETTAHRPSRKFLRAEKLSVIYDASNKDMQQATDMLHKPRAKELLESMLASHSDNMWVSAMLRHGGFEVSPEAARLYKHYYFNVDLLDVTELRVILQGRGIADASKDTDEKMYGTLMLKTNNMDPRRSAAMMTDNNMGALMTTIRMGIMPSNLELSRLAASARTAALVQTKENIHRGFADKSRDFALTAKLMSEVMEHIGDAQEDLTRSLANIQLETEEEDVVFINQLSDGNHTVDAVPIDTTAEEVPRGE